MVSALSSNGHGEPGRLILFGLLVTAAALRLVFFNGALGSDDLVYLNRSVQISEGVWSSAGYNGALRYGFNMPAGFFLNLFGINIFAANLWPLLCSLAEISAVYFFSHTIGGRQVALCSTLTLVFMPLHVASATRIHADPVVACFLTLSFVTFHFAEQQRSCWLYFFVGIAMGLVFWTKELAVITLLAFLFYPLIRRKIEVRWLCIACGGLVMLLAHFVLMRVIAGDPLHALKVVLAQMQNSFISGADFAEDGAWYYFKYLFFDIRHVGLAGVLAACSVVAFVFNYRGLRTHTLYLIFWLLALVSVLSFTPVSLSPIKLVMKQSNYLTLFLAPLALVAGYLIATLPTKIKLVVLFFTLTGGLFLAGLEQQAYRIFTSNSKAAFKFSVQHAGEQIVGSNNNGNIAAIYAMFDENDQPRGHFRYMSEFSQHLITGTSDKAVFVILDYETMAWGKGAVVLNQAPVCWEMVEVLVPTGFGTGRLLINLFDSTLELFPRSVYDRFKLSLGALKQPKPAYVYKANLLDFWCGQEESTKR